MECSLLNKSGEGNRLREPKVQIPEFSPSTAGYKLDPVNLPSSYRDEKKKKIAHPALPSLLHFCTKYQIPDILNKIENSL